MWEYFVNWLRFHSLRLVCFVPYLLYILPKKILVNIQMWMFRLYSLWLEACLLYSIPMCNYYLNKLLQRWVKRYCSYVMHHFSHTRYCSWSAQSFLADGQLQHEHTGTCWQAHTGPGHPVPDLQDTGSLVHSSERLRPFGSSSFAEGQYMSLHKVGHTLDTPDLQNTALLSEKETNKK